MEGASLESDLRRAEHVSTCAEGSLELAAAQIHDLGGTVSSQAREGDEMETQSAGGAVSEQQLRCSPQPVAGHTHRGLPENKQHLGRGLYC